MNQVLFEKKIEEQGLKRTFLAEQCGISLNSFNGKITGMLPPFNAKQIATLQYWLRLTPQDVYDIFLACWVQ